jgi:phage terminase large subunit-like protein
MLSSPDPAAPGIDALSRGSAAFVEPDRKPYFDVEAWAAKTAKPGDWFDEAAAEHACQFFERYLLHTKDRWFGLPFKLIPWQRASLRTMFGWKRADGTRRFRIVFIEIPRKNGKTTFAAGIGLYLGLASGLAGAEVYFAATDRDQACIAFNEAKKMRALSPAMKARTDVFKYSMVCPANGSKLEALSKEMGNKDGLNMSALIGDEVHAWTGREVYDLLHTSIGVRKEPMEVLITTSGSDETSFWGEMHDHAEKVRDGEIDDHEFLPILFCADADADLEDPAAHAQANPSLGYTVSAEYLAKEASRAATVPSYRNTFKRLHLNQRTAQQTLWLPMEHWDKCFHGAVTLEQLAGRRGFLAFDLSATTDLTALAGLFPRDDSPIVDLWAHFWLPKGLAARDIEEREKRDRKPYRKWAEEGLLTLTDGNVVDYDKMRAFIAGIEGNGGLMQQIDIAEIAYDRWGARQLATQLMGDGLELVEFGQGYASMSAPAKEFERRLLAHTLNHGNNPILRWMAQSVEIETDAAGNIKPVKPDRKRHTRRIDGIVALIMGLGRLIVNMPDEGSMDDFLAAPVMR